MIIKFIISLLIIYICTYLGIYKAQTYEIRERELKKIKSSLSFLKSKIEFTYEPIQEIFMQISKSVYLHKDNIFLKTTEYLKELELNGAWNKAVEGAQQFSKEDKEVLYMFGKLLGKTDKNGQISEIEISQSFIEKQIEKAEQEKIKNSKLYKSLGISLGIGIVIILI
ncbi:MAG: stage III sporulation protein AB [Clostridia bacterium]|nr:stage III sporulation protein AB [Clostridia bacterium]